MKNTIPFPVIVLGLIILGALVWFVTQRSSIPEVPENTVPLATTTPLQEENEETVVAPEPTPTLPPVVTETIWRNYVNELWKIEFKYKPEWKLSTVKSSKGAVDQITISNDDMNVFLSRNISVAEPALVEYTTYTHKIAGKEIEVHEYTKPNEQYAFYLFFVLPVGGDKYYISINSITDSKQPANDFMNRITVK